MTPPSGFGERLGALVDRRESQLILGLDPDLGALWTTGAETPATGTPVEAAAAAVLSHCLALIDAVAPACLGVKPQLARFELLGAPGRRILGEVVEHARGLGLLVIADGKRGDIDVTAEAYARSLTGGVSSPFGAIPGLGADLLTVNPLMGRDAIGPFVAAARDVGAGILLLVRTSNPGAADLEDLTLAGGETVWERAAGLVAELGGEPAAGSRLSDVGAVMGATVPEHLARARELMPHAVFLLPGIGAQGGRVEDLAPAFSPGRAGGLVSASRSVADAHVKRGGSPARAARAEAERLREAAWALAGQALTAL